MRKQIRATLALVTLVIATAFVTAQESISKNLRALADTERAFAKTATVKGLRDSFLDYFADDAIALVPEAASAKARLRAQEARPFSVLEIVWEPRTGEVAASNDLGWLTGPSTIVNHAAAQPGVAPVPRYGNYLSVWRRQPNGNWRVFIDVGASLPGPASFAPGFVPTPVATRYRGPEDKAAATRALLDADRELNDHLSSFGVARAYGERLIPASRLHRPGFFTAVGNSAIAAWLTEHAASMSAKATAAEASAAGDLGYSYGTYDIKSTPVESGAYVRVWMRDAAGWWFIVADVTQPS